METQTLNQLFAAACARHNKDDAILHKVEGEWKTLSSSAWLDAARDAAVGLSTRGVRKGDRVVLLSENRLEWFTIEAGLQILGAVTVPIYPTLTAQQAAYIIRDSGARVVIASSPEQQAKIAEVRDSLPDVEMIFTLDPPVAGSGTRSWSAVTDAGKGSRGVDSGAAERLAAAVSGDDVATIIYTSGTTGNPKGVMLSQQNLVHNTLASHEALTLTPEDRAISVLPYSHVFARMVAHYLYPHAGVTIAIAESMDTLVQNIGEVHPTVMACVPRFYEKMRGPGPRVGCCGKSAEAEDLQLGVCGRLRSRPPSPGRNHAFRRVESEVRGGHEAGVQQAPRADGRAHGASSCPGVLPFPGDVAEFFLAAGWVVDRGLRAYRDFAGHHREPPRPLPVRLGRYSYSRSGRQDCRGRRDPLPWPQCDEGIFR